MQKKLVPQFLFVVLYLQSVTGVEIQPSEPVGEQRFIFATKTVTNLVITTSTTSLAGSTFCYTIAASASNFPTTGIYSIAALTITISSINSCRRKRWAIEDPITGELEASVSPVEVRIEPSALVEGTKNLETELDGSLESDDKKNPRFGLSIIATVTQTLTAITSVTTSLATKTVILTCTPINFGFNACG